MAANPINIVDKRHAVQYDGTNSGDIAALDPGFSFSNDTEENGVWSFQSPPDSTEFVINTGDWIIFTQNQAIGKYSDTEFTVAYSCTPDCAQMETLQSVALAPKVQAVGIAPVPTLLLNQTATVTVTLQPAMSDATYNAYAHKFAGVSVGDLNITSVTVVDEDTVAVGVQNTGLTLTGASILVHAVA